MSDDNILGKMAILWTSRFALDQLGKDMQKRILITGKTSYIGTSLTQYLTNYPPAGQAGSSVYRTDSISLRETTWEQASFAGYDTLFHMAGIAHADIGHVSGQTKRDYYAVNCDLAVRVAEKARREGVRQFVYMSSVIVYGDSAPVGKQKHITAETIPAPANFYGDSKYQAEQKLQRLETPAFHVAIVRAPMIYGRDSRGNYRLLAKLAEKLPVFPSIENRRSMLYIENLTEFLRLLAESGMGGIFYPQNAEYVSTARMVQAIAAARGRRVRLWGIFNPFVRLAAHIPGRIGGMADKAFGSLTIDRELSRRGIDGYQRYGLEESIRRIHEDRRKQ